MNKIVGDVGIEYVPNRITDFSKLNIKEGIIYYRLYDQEGNFTNMTIKDTYSNRLLVSWIQSHDRYTKGA